MSVNWQWVADDAQLADVMAAANQQQSVAIDTEFMRTNTFYPEVALLQVCFDDVAWLIDPLAISDTSPIRALFQNDNVLKVLHSASEDLEVFDRWLGVLPEPLCDSQKAAALLGKGFGLGYRALVAMECDIDLPKGETRSNWLQRPLTDSQCDYAALDVIHLFALWHKLEQDLRAAGRLEWLIDEGRIATGHRVTDGSEYYKRIKSAWKLDRRQLACLMMLSRWRETQARARNKPRSWIVDDQAVLQIAQLLPQSLTSLGSSEFTLQSQALRRYGEDLIQVVAEAVALDESALPQRMPAPLPAEFRGRAKALKSRARVIAESLNLAPELLLQSKDYDILLRESIGQDVAVPPHWNGWRAPTVIEPLRDYLSGGDT
ncbi:MAG: ribonuclease D [Halioglobus sp.]